MLTLRPSHFYTLYSPSECKLRLYLNQKGVEAEPPGAFQQVLFRLGQRHEKSHLATFPTVSDLTGKAYTTTVEELGKSPAVIYQGALRAQVGIGDQPIEVVGIPDFIIREGSSYLIRDCKIARHADEDSHPEIHRQLQIYGWLFEQAMGERPLRLEVLKGDGTMEVFDYMGVPTVISYFQDLVQIISLSEEPYSPVGWSKCGGCGYNDYCMSRAVKAQDVALVYDLDQNLAMRLRELGVSKLKNW